MYTESGVARVAPEDEPCSRCYTLYKAGQLTKQEWAMRVRHSGSWRERFWAKVQRCTHGNDCDKCCWLWQAGCTGHMGYGQMQIGIIKGKKVRAYAHVVSWRIHNNMQKLGPLDQVTHTCDNPPCVNPYHLVLGNQQSNMDDKLARNREWHPTGELHGEAKLTEPQVRWLRNNYLLLPWTQQEFGTHLGVSRVKVGQILRGEAWFHIEDGLQSRIDYKLQSRRLKRS